MRDIACIILNYNDWGNSVKLARTLSQCELIDEVVIVDNKSTDESRNSLKKISGEKIKIIYSNINGGYGAGNNIGVRYIEKRNVDQYVMICNPDVEVSTDVIKKLRDYLVANSDCAIVTPRPVNKLGERKERPGWNFCGTSGFLVEMNSLIYKLFGKKNWVEFGDADCVQGSLLMFPVKIMVEYGMYDEDFFLYCEESVLGSKLKNAGYHAHIIKETYKHLHSISTKKSIDSAFRRKKILLESQKLYLRKYLNVGKVKMILLEPYFLFTLLINVIIEEIRG